MHQLRQCIGHATRADIVYRQDGILVTHLPATVNHLLRAALHLGVAALHRIKIQILGIFSGIHAGRRTAAKTDQHAGSAQMHHQCADRQFVFMRMDRRDVTYATGQHDGLVITTHFATDALFKGAKISGQVRASEFIVECRRADRTVEHDLQRGDDAVWFAVR